MSHDVFICFSSKDKEIAERLYAWLGESGVRCWIASRDVPFGTNYQEQIVKAIGACKVLLLVFTANSDASIEVPRELSLASQHRKPILPVKLDNAVPGEAMQYTLATSQWLDLSGADNAEVKSHLSSLVNAIRFLSGTEHIAVPNSPVPVDSAPGSTAKTSQSSDTDESTQDRKIGRGPQLYESSVAEPPPVRAEMQSIDSPADTPGQRASIKKIVVGVGVVAAVALFAIVFGGVFKEKDSVSTTGRSTANTPSVAQVPPSVTPSQSESRGGVSSEMPAARSAITECDRLAGSPDDPQKKFDGVTYAQLNSAEAVPACKKAVAEAIGEGRLWFQYGRSLEKANQMNEAVAAYSEGMKLGHSVAHNNMGELYRDGKFFRKDLARAAELFKQSAELGSPEGKINLAALNSPASQSIAASAPSAVSVIDGSWYSQEWRYGYTLKNGIGKATSTNSPNFKVGQEIIFLESDGNGIFRGRQVYTDGKFYAVTAVPLPTGELQFSGENNARWVMRRVD